MKYSRRDFNKLSLPAAASTLISRQSDASYNNVSELFDKCDATDIADHVRRGLVSPLELLEEAIRCVELINPRINAVTQKHYDLAKSATQEGLPQDAGLVIFGKTNTPEYGLALTTENLFLGDCLNPWNTAYSTGGSSGGSAAAAVASRVVPLAHGTDGGGSIRVPANHCGVTPGVSDAGMSIGHALSRSVRDSPMWHIPVPPINVAVITGGNP